MNPALISLIGGVAGGLFGGRREPEVPMGMRWILPLLKRNALFMEQYAKGVPGSDPGEQAALASAQSLLGQQFGQQEQQFAAMQNPYGPNAGNTGDQQKNLGASQNAQQAAMLQAMMQGFQQQRKGARGTAVGIAQGAGNAVPFMQQPGTDLGAIFGQLAQQQAMMQAMNNSKPGNTVYNFGGGGGAGAGGGWAGVPFALPGQPSSGFAPPIDPSEPSNGPRW